MKSREHYCTMFDGSFLPMGLALHESLTRHDSSALLWVLCLDAVTLRVLTELNLQSLRPIPIETVETSELRAVKGHRTATEYYWTLTPSILETVLNRIPGASRLTYLDADLYFFRSPKIILDEMRPEHHALITDHGFAPRYSHYASTSGQFCVQFVTVSDTDEARSVVAWWRERCLEWCYDRSEGNLFGDQRYLESWPSMLHDRLLTINRPDWFGAPWNACLADTRETRRWIPVVYHFHGFRCLTGGRALLFPTNYEIGRQARWLYGEYIAAVKRSDRVLRKVGFTVTGSPTPAGLEDFDPWPIIARRLARLLRRRLQRPVSKPVVSIR